MRVGRWLAWVSFSAGLLLVTAAWVQANDNLLDPAQIGAARKSMSTEKLLDPGAVGARSRAPSDASVVRSANNRPSSAYARDMAESVVQSLASLTRAAADKVDEIASLDSKAAEMSDQTQKLQDEMEHKMGEFRSGLFCSGCKKTKSEILASGSTFPHPGQKIIRPTPEEIVAKERELQAPIDLLNGQLHTNRANRQKLVTERDEALTQIGFGLNLWRTSVSFEIALITMDEQDSLAAHNLTRRAAEEQVEKLNADILNIKRQSTIKLARLRDEGKLWADKLAAAEANLEALGSERTQAQARLLAALPSGRTQWAEKLKQLDIRSAAYNTERTRATGQIEKLRDEIAKAEDNEAVLALTREQVGWEKVLEQLNVKRINDRRANQSAQARAADIVRNEQFMLNGYLSRGRLSTVLTAAAISDSIGPGAGFNDLGGLYRMGSYGPSGHGEVLPSVNSFVTAFLSNPQAKPEMPPKPEMPLVPPLKGMLRDLLKCDPEEGKKCETSRKNVGTGVRG